MSKPVFVLTTAADCPGCVAFKTKVWPKLKEILARDDKVEIVHIELETTRSKPDPTKYHKDFARFVAWFPTMSLFPADRWHDRSSELIGVVKNGKFYPPTKKEDGTIVPEKLEPYGDINMSGPDILKWVDYTITNDPIFLRNNKKISVPTAASVRFRHSRI